MNRTEKPDRLNDLLSSMKPLEPRPGLEHEIYARIMEEPVPVEMPKRGSWSWFGSTAAVASFIGALVLIGGFLFVTREHSSNLAGSASSAGGANQSASMAKQDSATRNMPEAKQKSESPDSTRTMQSAGTMKSMPPPALTRGLRITLKEPADTADQAQAKRVGETMTPDDLSHILKELYTAGAEWVSVNGVRVSADEKVTWQDNSLSMQNTVLSAPYVVEVSGDPLALRQAIERQGSQIDTLKKAAKITIDTNEIK